MFCLVMSFSASSSFLRLMPMMGARMRMPFLALLHLAAKLVPRIQASNAGCVRPLPCDLQNVSEAVIVESAHRVEVGGECIASVRPQAAR